MDVKCRSSVLQVPIPAIDAQTIELMTSMTPTFITLAELEDTGTKCLQSIAGFESATCGTWTYTVSSSQPWIIQDLSDDQTFSIDVDEDASLIGDHTLSVEVSSDNYPSEISAYMISVLITVTSADPTLWIDISPESLCNV